MKYVQVPEDIQLSEKESISLQRWLCEFVLLDPGSKEKTAQDILCLRDIIENIKSADGVIKLSDYEYGIVKAAVDKPSGGYNPAVALKIVAFIRAVLNPKEAPEE